MHPDSKEEGNETTPSPSSTNSAKPANGLWLAAGIVVLVVTGAGFFLLGDATGPNTTGLVTGTSSPNQGDERNAPSADLSPKGVDVTDPSQYLSRQQYFEGAFQPNRDEYQIFSSASLFSEKPLSEMPVFFDVSSEEDIFSALPSIPSDFSEIAYLLASGKFFAIKGLGPGYWKQPEFYPNFKKGGLRYWTQPDPTSWASNGYGIYPSEQWGTVKTGETDSFEATVFLYSGFGVQTYQGITLYTEGNTKEYFDITISPQTFILEPNFPKFSEEWAKKIIISGEIKQGTPKGEYALSVNIGVPPEDMREKWGMEYRNLYMDGAAGLRPSGSPILLHVIVE